jgi:tetratricopeptide (TPR) repeat protein
MSSGTELNTSIEKEIAVEPALLSTSNSISSAGLFELANLYFQKCDFTNALSRALEASNKLLEEKNFDHFLKCQSIIIRIYAEREEFEKVNEVKERLQDLVLKNGVNLNAKTFYTLGRCAVLKRQYDSALEYFQKALALGLANDDKEDMCYAIMGLAITYSELGKLSEALKEIYNLQVFFEVLNLPEIKLSSQILNGIILRKMERYDQALEVFWACFDLIKVVKNLLLYNQLLYSTGVTYAAMGESDLAKVYLQLANRSIDPNNLKALHRDIELRLKELGVKPHDEYDLVFDPGHKAVVEKKKGKVDFRNQFILLDLLHLFAKSPGQIYSKEQLTQKIWSEEYDPSVHDNKIYVTIKRLRKMIEPDYEKPRYIYRAKNGYYLNKNTRVLIEQ